MVKMKYVAPIGLFVLLYIVWSFWISRDVRKILSVGMENEVDYTPYMTDAVYKKLNPYKRGMKDHRTYHSELHKVGYVKPIHLFIYAKAWTYHKYETKSYGFIEPVTLTLKLEGFRWKAVDIYIKP